MSSQLVWLAMSMACSPRRYPMTRMRAPMIHAAAARKRGGQPERRKMSLVATWIGATIAKSRSRPGDSQDGAGVQANSLNARD